MSIVTFSIRTDAKLKKQVDECLSAVGLTMTAAIHLYLHQIVRHHGIPFEIVSTPLAPPQDILEAIEEGERIASDPDGRACTDMKELINALNS